MAAKKDEIIEYVMIGVLIFAVCVFIKPYVEKMYHSTGTWEREFE